MRTYFFLLLLCLTAASENELLIKYNSSRRFSYRQDAQPLPPLAPFTCRVRIFDNTMHKGDFLFSWKKVQNVNDCIGYCSQYTKGPETCRAINYFSNIQGCDLLSKASSNPSLEPVPSNIVWANVKHAIIVGCDGTSTSPPVIQPTSPLSFQPNECGKQFTQPKVNPVGSRNRIINGDDATPHSWPWIVSITYYGKHVCGGSLVAVMPGLDESDVVLTAAHCVKDGAVGQLNVNSLTVVAGSHSRSNKENGEQEVPVESMHYHDYFMPDGLMNDIAMLKLKSPIKFSKTIVPICLPSNRDATPVDSTCVAAGWGRYVGDTDKTLADKLQQLRVPVVDAAACKNPSVWGGHVNTATMLCAGTLKGNQNVCTGDSGGALMCRVNNRWIQHGIVSFVYRQNCTAEKKPGVYTRVSMYRPWIDETIGKRSAVFKKAKRQG